MLVATIVCAPTAVPGVYSPLELMSPTLLLPPLMPSTVQLALLPPGTVAVNCCDCDSVNAATVGAMDIEPLATVTVADASALGPPAPVQLSEYAVVLLSAPVLLLPLVPRVPAQPPEAVQLVALVELQESVEEPPLETVVGLALRLAVAAPRIATDTDAIALEPPAPEQTIEKVAPAVRGPAFSLPLAASVPLQPPEAVQLVALVELQESVDEPPFGTEVGLADNDAVGTTLTVVEAALLVPPGPLQVME